VCVFFRDRCLASPCGDFCGHRNRTVRGKLHEACRASCDKEEETCRVSFDTL
jgi:hypothetical protein